jgi:sRNA-binding carbon storage regulator CsrA
MKLDKAQIKSIVTTAGTHTVPRPETPAEISILRSRLWQAAKRNNSKVSCSVEKENFVIQVAIAN